VSDRPADGRQRTAALDGASMCPVCGAADVQRVYDFVDFFVLSCRRCGNGWRSNMYSRDSIMELYSSDEYARHPYFAVSDDDIRAQRIPRLRNYERALAYVESIAGIGTLLDVGCGAGAFLSIATARGWAGEGVELSPTLSKVCERTTQVPVKTGRFEEVDLPEGRYSFVTLWDIIEHVIDPVACIAKAASLLRPGGIVLFCTPDEDSLLARTGWALYKLTAGRYRYPALALHPAAHTYFFSRTGFRRMLERQGLTVLRSYSQEAYFDHSPLASRAQKLAIALIERLASVRDARYESVFLARSAR